MHSNFIQLHPFKHYILFFCLLLNCSVYGQWIQKGQDINGLQSFDNCGKAVSINSDGNTIAIGYPGANGSNGYVRIFYWNGSNWIAM